MEFGTDAWRSIGSSLAAKCWGGNSVMEWWMASGAAETGTWPRPEVGQGHGCRQQHLSQATTSPSSVPPIASPDGLCRIEPPS
jgi:hypothetical protein